MIVYNDSPNIQERVHVGYPTPVPAHSLHIRKLVTLYTTDVGSAWCHAPSFGGYGIIIWYRSDICGTEDEWVYT